MSEQQDDLRPAPEPEGESVETPKPAEPSPYAKELEEVRSRQARIEQLATQAAQAALQAQQSAYAQPQRSAYAEPAEQEEDFDPSDKQAVLRMIDKRAQKIAQGLASQYDSRYQTLRQQDETRFALMQRDRTYEELRKLGMEDLAPEVDEYIRQANITPGYLSDPRAWETVAATVLGQKKMREARESASRAPLLGSSGGRSALPTPRTGYTPTMLDDNDVALSKKHGLDPEEAELFLRGEVSATSYDEFQARRAARGRR